MEYSVNHSLTLSFTNSDDIKEIDLFLNVLKKCNTEANKSGFKGMFNKDEKLLVQSMWTEFGDDTK